jgi:enoyl-[acyl-carrier protein] reductase III
MHRPIALVTGASGEIGRAAALALARRGFDVAIHHRCEPDQAREVAVEVEKAGAASLVLASGLEDQGAVRAVVDAVEDRFGHLDTVIASDATVTAPFGSLAEFGTQHYDSILATVIESFVVLYQEAVTCMQGRLGSIVAVTGNDAIRVVDHRGHLGAATVLLEPRIPPLARDCRPNVALSAIRAGLIATESTRRWADGSYPGGFVQLEADLAGRTPATRIADPTEIAEIIAFLCSPPGRLFAGQILLADNTMSLSKPFCTSFTPD